MAGLSALLPVDPLFQVPFLTGLVLALAVPALGPYLRLRNEWLATLAYCQVATGGGVVGTLAGLPALPVALAAAAAAALAKGMRREAGNDLYAVAILFGWVLMILGMANSVEAHRIGDALLDGQLYFATGSELAGAVAVGGVVAAALPRLSRRLLEARLYPGQQEANARPVRALAVAFDLLVALALGFAATAMGIMTAFALAFLPAWVAFALAPSWRGAVAIACAIGLAAYAAAFALALALDQPFGPLLVAILVLALPLRRLAPRRRGAA